ncbi:MAG: hypothetical protein M3380_14795, partial [Chloroflexota bacterium]|nr:hypothetical protein [Chloroflexota bacterium]
AVGLGTGTACGHADGEEDNNDNRDGETAHGILLADAVQVRCLEARSDGALRASLLLLYLAIRRGAPLSQAKQMIL